MNQKYEPKILALLCTYCTYTAADMAGSMRLQYPANVRVVKLLCTGKVDQLYILECLQGRGRRGDGLRLRNRGLPFLEGNLRAKERVEHAKSFWPSWAWIPAPGDVPHRGVGRAQMGRGGGDDDPPGL
jgi:F420-non-reducing hydrogenase iron-sulfur subunit